MAADYMGDYDAFVWVKKSFLAVWGDNRDSDRFFTNQPDVRRASVSAQ